MDEQMDRWMKGRMEDRYSDDVDRKDGCWIEIY